MLYRNRRGVTRERMKVIAIVGDSGSGKTRLITRLIPELKKQGVSVAVIKHCAHGFDLGGRRKDSSKVLAAGAVGAGLVSGRMWAVIRTGPKVPSLTALARSVFADTDIVLVEGGRGDPRLKKIEVVRSGKASGGKVPKRELAAVVADGPVRAGVPVFRPGEAARIAAWLKGGLR
jgi:molybdopterin-guanine dinucleotide biosynthesis adapter protein